MSSASLPSRDALSDLLQKRALRYPHDTAYCYPELKQSYTWLRTWNEARQLAKGLLRLGVRRGDRIALLMQGRMEMLLAIYAASFVGAVAVPLNGYSKQEELRHYLQDSRPVLMIMGSEGHHLNYLHLLQELIVGTGTDAGTENDRSWIPERFFVVTEEDNLQAPFAPFSELAELGDGIAESRLDEVMAECRASDPFVLLYTSGTSGRPKGVLRTSASFLVRADSARRKESVLFSGIVNRVARRFSMLSLLPLYHLGGFVMLFTTLKNCNFRLVMLTRFSPVQALSALETERCTFMSGTPFMIQRMLFSPARADYNLGSLLGIVFTSAAMNGNLLKKVSEDSGLKLAFFLVSYGSSEAGQVANGICFMNREKNLLSAVLYYLLNATSFLSGVVDPKELERSGFSFGGKVDKTVEVKIIDPDTGAELPSGAVGEIAIRSHRVMRYLNEKEAAGRFTPDGYYRSGDLGTLDERRYLMISGRLNRIISRGGEKISPVEIENILLEQEGVREAFVLGLPDELYGEIVCACVVPHEGAELSEERLRSGMASRLSAFKIPQHIVTVPDFPLSPTGKISVSDVRMLAEERMGDVRKNA